MGRILATVLVAVLCSSVRAGPIQLSYNSESCARTCTDNGKFQYDTGRTYLYQYDTDIKTVLQGASEDHSSVHMSATVQLEVISNCEISMWLKDVTLTEHDPEDMKMKEVSAGFKSDVEQYPMRVSFQNGRVAELCLTGEESVWVLNLKRGLISMIQNNMDDFSVNQTVTENDVSGNCETDYFTKESGWYTTTIGKSKNLLGCTDRHGYNTAVQGIPYTSDSDIQSLPLLKSDHNCVHEIDRRTKTVKSIKCVENHVFRPFSNGGNGAVTTTTQTLTFKSTTTGTSPPAPILNRVPLTFDHVYDLGADDRSRKDITRKLLEICEKTKSGVKSETPRLFTELVYLMKSADTDTISSIFKMLNEDTICPDNIYRTRKFFLDALPVAGTTASVHLITELVTSHVITGIEAEMWLTSLAFIKKPTKDMLIEVKPLINMDDNVEKAMLSVGTLVHSYCYHQGNCDNDDVVKAIVSAFVNKMVKGCKVGAEDMKTTLMALRGLGNAGYASSAIPQLEVCMQVSSNPIEIRLSAIEAFRRMPCDSDRSGLMGILPNKEEDSELRIAAYRVLMECPSTKVLRLVKNTLTREEVNQVGSYIWTHLTNLMETSDRHKQDIRAVLEDEKLAKVFDLDQRKFSRNYEKSFFIEKVNTGAKVEGDLIWSSKSFVPRSAMVNLTFDLFGHSVNLFEIGGRAEGLEYFLESFFGPSGYFGKQTEESDASENIPEGISDDKIKKIDKRFSAQMAELRGSMYMRVFGNELRYMNFIGLNDALFGSNVNPLDMMLKMADENDFTYSHSTMFLDSSFIVPTISGFPLNLTVNGTAMLDLRVKGKMDVRNMDIGGLIQPSAAIDISSMMSVDAHVTKTGIKMVSTLHTSTSVQGKVRLDKDGSLSVEYEMPEPRMEIIDVKSSFFTIHRDVEREQKMIAENRQTHSLCSPRKLVTVTGLELCAEVLYASANLRSDAPYFPLTGPISAGVYLYNRDTHTKYKLEGRSIHNKERNQLQFVLDTPGSMTDRHIELNLNLNKQDLSLDASFTSPWTKGSMQGAVVWDESSYGVNGKMDMSNGSPYSIKALLNRGEKGNSLEFTPSVEITIPGWDPISLTGSLEMTNGKQIDTRLELGGFSKSPITGKATIHNKPALIGIEGSMEWNKNRVYSMDMTFKTQNYKKKVVYTPLVSVRSPDAEVLAFGGSTTIIFGKGVDVNLVLDKVVEKMVALKAKVMQVDRKRRLIYNAKVDFQSSPGDLYLKAKIDNRSFRTVAADIDFAYVIRKIARDKIKLVSKISNLSSKSLTKLRGALNFESNKNPERNLKIIGEIDHKNKHTNIEGDLWYGEDLKSTEKHVELRFELNHNVKDLMNAEADVQTRFRFPELGLSMMLKGAHGHDKHNLNSNLTAKFGKSGPLETSLRIQDKTGKLLNIDAEFQLSFEGFNLALDHDLVQMDSNIYTSTLKAGMKKDQFSTIVTSVQRDSGRTALRSEINLFGESPAIIQGELSLEPTDFVTSLTFERDAKKYSASLMSATEIGKSSWVKLDLYHPDRQFIASVNGKKNDDMFSGDAILQLDDTQKFAVTGWFETPRLEKINGSISVSLPERTFTLNAHHTQGSKYLTHADFQWAPDEQISAETTLDIMDGDVIFNAQLTTPFSALPEAKLNFNHRSSNEEYRTASDLTWGKDGSFSLESGISHAISLRSVVGTVSVKSSLSQLKKFVLDVNHKISSSLASAVKVTLNRQFIEADVILQNTTKGKNVGFQGNFDLKTSFRQMKKGSLEISHTNDGKTFSTSLTAAQNKKTYTVKSDMVHEPLESSYSNSGSITATVPDGYYAATWDHRHSRTNLATLLKTSWDKTKEISLRISSSFDEPFSTTIDFQSPFESVRDARLVVSHIRQSGAMDSKASVTVNGQELGSADIGYSNGAENKAAGISLLIPELNVDSKIQAKLSVPTQRPLTAKLDVIITPEISMSIEGTQTAGTGQGDAHSTILWKSSFPGYEQLRLSYEVLADSHLASVTQLEYGEGKVIRLETKLLFDRFDNIEAAANLSTPFDKLSKLQFGMRFKGNLDSLTSEAFLEVQPFFDRVSAQFSLDTRTKLTASLRIDTPVTDYRYFSADLSGSFSHISSGINMKVEYVPGQIMQLETNHLLSDSSLSLSGKGSSPYGTISLRHSGSLQDFSSSVSFETTDRKKYGIEAKFSNKDSLTFSVIISSYGRRDITASFSHSGSADNFVTHAEITHNRKNSFMSDLTFNSRNTVNIEASGSLKSQFISNTKEYAGRFSLSGLLTKFVSHGEFSTTPLEKSEFDLSVDLTDVKESTLSVKSPFVKDIHASVSYVHQDSFMQSKVDLTHGEDNIVDAQVTVSTTKAIVFDANLKNAWTSDAKVMVRVDGRKKNFVLRAEGAYGIKKADMDLSSEYDIGKIHQKLTARATGVQDIAAEFSFSGDSTNVKTFAAVKVGQGEHRFDVTLLSSDSLEATVGLRSPYISDISAKLKHEGRLQNFKSHADYSFGNKSSSVDVTYSGITRYEGLLTVRSHLMQDLAIGFEHSGTAKNFKSHGEYNYGLEKREVDWSVSAEDNVEVEIRYKCPVHGYSTLRYQHNGSPSSFNCHADLTIRDTTWEGDFSWRTKGDFHVQLHLKPDSYYGYEEFNMLFHQSGSATNFSSHGEISYGQRKSSGDLSFAFNSNQMDISAEAVSPYYSRISNQLSIKRSAEESVFIASLQKGVDLYRAAVHYMLKDKMHLSGVIETPFDGYKILNASYEHSGSLRNFQCTGKIALDNEYRALKIQLDTRDLNNIRGSFDIDSSDMKPVSLQVTHTHAPETYQSNFDVIVDSEKMLSLKASIVGTKGHLELTFDGQTRKVMDIEKTATGIVLTANDGRDTFKITFSSKPKHTGTFSWSSPDKTYLSASMVFSGSVSDFTSNSELIVNGEEIGRVAVSWKLGEIKTATFLLVLPKNRQVTGELTMAHTEWSLNFDSKLSVDMKTLFDLSLNSDLDRRLLKFSLRSSEPHPLLAKLYITSTGSQLISEIELSHKLQTVFKGNIDVTVRQKPLYIDGVVSFTRWTSENSVSIHIDMSEMNFRANGTLEMNGKSWIVTTNFDQENDVDTNLNVQILEGDQIRGSVIHTMRGSHIKTDAYLRFKQTQNYVYSMVLARNNGYDGTVTVQTPIKGFETTKVHFDLSGNLPNIKSTGEVLFANRKLSETISIDGGNIAFTLKTPFPGFESLALSTHYKGELKNFKAGGKIEYGPEKDIEIEIEHSLTGTLLKSKILFRSPFTEDISFTADHNGVLEDFSTEAVLRSSKYLYKMDAMFQLQPVIEFSLGVMTPFENFKDLRTTFSHSGNSANMRTTGEMQFAPEKKISGKFGLIQGGWKHMVTSLELATPFEGMELNKMSYKHTADSDSFQCEVESTVYGTEITGTLTASRAPYSVNLNLKTPFTGFETPGLSGNFMQHDHQYTGRFEMKWNLKSQIEMDMSLSTARPVVGSFSLVTPFENIRQVSAALSERQMVSGMLESLEVMFNSKKLVDVDLEHMILDFAEGHKHVLLAVRSPWPMRFEFDGDFSKYLVDFDLTADWNSNSADSNLKLEAGYNLRRSYPAYSKVIQPRLPAWHVITISGAVVDIRNKFHKAVDVWDYIPSEKAGYDLKSNDYDGTVKLMLPARSLEFSGTKRGRVLEGSFLWDADVDPMRRITIRTVTVPASNIIKSDITVALPSLGKNITVSSEFAVNQGRVLFNGKSEIAYSGDSRKNIAFSTKLEDISTSPSSQNYSFSVGLQHPYSTVGISLDSHAGISDTGFSAGVRLDYLTVRNQMNRLQIGSRVDTEGKSLSFELQSPVKTISISGNVQTDNNLRVSLLNIYDHKPPLSTIFTMDTRKRAVDFAMNYDLDHPRNELCVSAKYVNSSAVAAEVYHITDGEPETDILVTVRLNNSHLIHSRLHWRPELLSDLKAHFRKKMDNYQRRLHASGDSTQSELAEEFQEKLQLIYTAVEEEIGRENIQKLSFVVIPIVHNGLKRIQSAVQPAMQTVNNLMSAGTTLRQVQDSYEGLDAGYHLEQLEARIKNQDLPSVSLPVVRQTVSDNINFISEKVRLPSRHIPKYTTNLLRQAVIFTSDMMPEVVAKRVDSARLWGMDEVLESYIREEIQKLEKSTERYLREAEKIILAYLKSPITIYDPQHGEIQMEMYSVIPLQSLDRLPELNVAKYLKNIWDMIDGIEISLPSRPHITGEWVPPFTGVASVSKGHRITTFDGYVYDLENDCAYMLSRDYTDGNFSIILSNDGYTTLTVLTTGKPVSVRLNGDVSLGDKIAAIPFQEGFVTVSRKDDDTINIKGDSHFNIDYDLSVDHMTIEVSGWYHGKTGGLLGIYDNEPSNDLMTSFSKVIDNSERFAKTWEVSSNKCR